MKIIVNYLELEEDKLELENRINNVENKLDEIIKVINK